MKRLTIIMGFLIFSCGFGAYIFFNRFDSRVEVRGKSSGISDTNAITSESALPSLANNHIDKPSNKQTLEPTHVAGAYAHSSRVAPKPILALSTPPVGKPTPPPALAGFWSWPDDHRERIVSSLQSDPGWSPEVRLFIEKALSDSTLSPVTRNNMAVGLLRQEPHLENLHRIFLRMASDPNEEAVWREYALQFLAQVFPRAPEPDQQIITAKLKDVMLTQKGPEVGTALLQLSRLSEEAHLQLDEQYDVLLLKIIQDEQQMESNRSTALSVLGQRSYVAALPVARALLGTNSAVGVKRAAIGAVSLLGDQTDKILLNRLTSDADPSLRLVAKQAVTNLEARLAVKIEK